MLHDTGAGSDVVILHVKVVPEIVNCARPETFNAVNALLVVIPVNVQDETDVHDNAIQVVMILLIGRLTGLVRSVGRVVVNIPPESDTLPDRVRV